MSENNLQINTTAQNALKNSVYNFIGFLLPIVILVFFTPLIISKLGVKEYGILIFLNTILTFLGLIDLGVGIATNKHLVEYYSTGQIDRLKKLLYSMNSVYFLQGVVYLIISFISGVVLQIFFVKETTQVNYMVLLSIMGATGLIASVFSNFTNSLVAIQRYDLHLKINSFFLLFSNIGILVVVTLGYKLVSILLIQFVTMLLSSFCYYIITRRVFSILQFKYSWNFTEIKTNYRYAIPVAFNNLANSSLVHFDKLLIPVFLGAAPLTYYSVPGSIATKISSISATFSSLLFPIAVNLHALKDSTKMKRVYLRSIRIIALVSFAIAISVILTSDKILLYWLGEDFSKQSFNVLILLTLTNFVLALFSPLSNILTAMNKMKFLTTGSIIMAGINIISLSLLIPRYGINGAALAYLISVLFIFWMFYYSEKTYFDIDTKVHLKLFVKLFITSIPFYFIVKFFVYPTITSLFHLIILGPASVLLFMILYKLLGFVEEEDWRELKILLNKLF